MCVCVTVSNAFWKIRGGGVLELKQGSVLALCVCARVPREQRENALRNVHITHVRRTDKPKHRKTAGVAA